MLLSWCSIKGIGVSSRLVPTNIVTVGWCLHEFIKISFMVFSDWVSMLNFVHCDLSLYVIIVSQLMND
jgi:hypothetical protein